MPIHLLVTIPLQPDAPQRLRAAGFELHHAVAAEDRAQVLRALGGEIRAVLTNGSTGLTAEAMAELPRLEMICATGAGYEKIDLTAAAARGIVVTHGPGTNDASVADHAMALLMAALRGIVTADAAARQGKWADSRQPRPMISGKKLGILGLGTIGQQIAQRGAGGFSMPIGYHNRRPREGSAYRYFATPQALAEWCDVLVLATPGGAGTTHLVDAAVLKALGPQGFLVNIARGSVVDTAALVAALEQGGIAGAGLDVVEGEPVLPAGLAKLGNVVLTPHIAGRSPESMAATIGRVIENLTAHFAGRPVPTPVPRA
jgi:lactate dehydrogenase-like 2-hydroxyacid dehydrogenase